MSRYKIATKTDTLRYKIAKEVFGEIEDSDGVRDVPSWEIFEKCLEQHKTISTLEKQLADSEAQNKRVLEKLELLVRSNQELEKALENAIVPKFKIGQECYAILGKDIESIKVEKVIATIGKLKDETFTFYSITDSDGYACRTLEEQLFATKKEAKAKLKELKKDE